MSTHMSIDAHLCVCKYLYYDVWGLNGELGLYLSAWVPVCEVRSMCAWSMHWCANKDGLARRDSRAKPTHSAELILKKDNSSFSTGLLPKPLPNPVDSWTKLLLLLESLHNVGTFLIEIVRWEKVRCMRHTRTCMCVFGGNRLDKSARQQDKTLC